MIKFNEQDIKIGDLARCRYIKDENVTLLVIKIDKYVCLMAHNMEIFWLTKKHIVEQTKAGYWRLVK